MGANMIGCGLADVTVGVVIAKDQAGNWPVGLRFGTGGGDAVVKTRKGNNHTIKNIQAGETFPASVQMVVSVTGTVADIVAYLED